MQCLAAGGEAYVPEPCGSRDQWEDVLDSGHGSLALLEFARSHPLAIRKGDNQ